MRTVEFHYPECNVSNLRFNLRKIQEIFYEDARVDERDQGTADRVFETVDAMLVAACGRQYSRKD